MKPLAYLSLLVMAVAMLGACGGPSGSASTRHAASSQRSSQFLGDGDFDVGDGDPDNNWDTDSDAPFDYYNRQNESWNRGLFHDHDDIETLTLWSSADAREARAVTRVATRYYEAAAHGDGRSACAMLLPSVARSLTDYRLTGIPYLRGARSCADALRLLFRHHGLSVPHVTAVRAQGDAALALWGSRTMPAGYITLVRRHGRWLVTAPIGSTLL